MSAKAAGCDVAHVLWRGVSGGAERHVLDLAHGLPEHGFRCGVVYLATDDGLAETLRPAAIPCHICGLRRAWDPRGPARVQGALERLGPRIVHDHVSAPWVRAFLPTRDWKVIASEHGHVLSPALAARPLHTFIERLSARRTHHFIAPSEAVAAGVVAVLGVPRERITVVYHGIGASTAPPPAFSDGEFSGTAQRSPSWVEARAALGIPADRIVIAYAGRLVAEKGVFDLWDAFARVVAEEPRAHLLVFGEGPASEQLARLRGAASFAGSTQFCGHRPDLGRLLPGADIFVLPSRREALGIAMLEAMAHELPVVATRAGGIPEVVVDGETGLLTPVGDPQALAHALLTLARDPERGRALGRAGRERQRDRFTLARCLVQTADVYRRLLNLDGATHRGDC